MSGCQDPRIAHLLSAYELGMLGDEERREVELHLLDCDACYAELRQFQHAARLLRQDRDVRESVRYLAQEHEELVLSSAERTPRRSPWSRPITALLVAAAAMLLLILQPWEVEFHPTQEAVAVGPRLAIMYFENLADREDEQQLGEIAANLLITDLSESGYLQVISGQRLYDILKLLGREGQKRIDRDIAREVADTAAADVMLLGSILQTEPYFVLTARLVDVRTGDVVASQHITGVAGEDIFAQVDKLTAEIKKDLTLPAGAGTEPDRQVAEVTTHSPEAYRLYLDGIEKLNKFYHEEAASSFCAALQLDSTFAMAYYYLAELSDRNLIDKAMLYITHASYKEQFFIRSRKTGYSGDLETAIAELQNLISRYPDEKIAYYRLGQFYSARRDYELAAVSLNKALAIDPLYRQAINYLAYVYNWLGQYELAIGAINSYISLAPDEPNPYDTRGDIYAKNGKAGLAIESYRKALEIKPDFTASSYKLGHLYVLTHDYVRADSVYRLLAGSDDANSRSLARIYLPYSALCRGKLAEAVAIIDSALTADSTDGLDLAQSMNVGCKHFVKAIVLVEQQETDRALDELEEYMAVFRRSYPDAIAYDRNYYAEMMAELGELSRAMAIADSLKTDLEHANADLGLYWHAIGAIRLIQGDPVAAIEALDKISVAAMDYPKRFLLARAYFEAGQLAEAAAGFEALLVDYSSMRAYWCLRDAKVRYYLGRVYEASRWFGKAVIEYEGFLNIWRDADPGIPEIDDARERLARLREQS